MADPNAPKRRKGLNFLGEIGFFLFALAIMVGGMVLANRLERDEVIPMEGAFMIKEFTQYIAKIGLLLVFIWAYVRIGFPDTLGLDFRERFNRGWAEMSDVEATKWMIIVFLGLFIGAALLALS